MDNLVIGSLTLGWLGSLLYFMLKSGEATEKLCLQIELKYSKKILEHQNEALTLANQVTTTQDKLLKMMEYCEMLQDHVSIDDLRKCRKVFDEDFSGTPQAS